MKKKTVGIITILKVNNYGAELQAYATQKIMNLLGYDAEIIDYLYYRNLGHIKEKSSLHFYPYPLRNRIKEYGLRFIDIIGEVFMSDTGKLRKYRFEEFHRLFTKFSPTQYKCYSELFNNPPKYDAYCVGSDQVWNPRCYTNLNPYFLRFAPYNAVKFSYASSFGVSTLPECAKAVYAECLSNIKNISVREKGGVDIVNQLTGREAALVADPTLLLSKAEWQTVEKPINDIPEKYILVYELHPIRKIMEIATYMAGHIGCKIIRICKDTHYSKNTADAINIVDAGPSEFIYLFNHATVVVTNSFHGTAFSLNFKKDFYCVLSKKASNNSRQLGLLNLCGMSDRIIYDDQPMPDLNTLSINYDKASKILEEFKSYSIKYIRRAIDGTA